MKSILDILISSNQVPPEKIEDFRSRIKLLQVKKGTILQHIGDRDPKAYYVRKGLLRSYTIDQKGKEHIYIFAPEGWIIADNEAGTRNISAQLFVDALEDCELEVVEPDMMGEIMTLPPSLLATEVSRLLKRIAVLQKRVIMLMSATAQERYEHFLETYPQIVQRVPQKMIASYLGITPEALSKIRGEMVKSK